MVSVAWVKQNDLLFSDSALINFPLHVGSQALKLQGKIPKGALFLQFEETTSVNKAGNSVRTVIKHGPTSTSFNITNEFMYAN